MNTKPFVLILALALTQPGSLPAATNDLATALQKGLFEEEANHDLSAAIRAYQAIATQFDKDRKLAATAIFRLGECYRKQGNTNDANAQYERVLREFADQTPLATLSRQNLELLGGSAPAPTGSPLSNAARQEQKRLLQEEIKLLAEQTLVEQQRKLEAGIDTQDAIRTTQREILRLKRQLAGFDIEPFGNVDLGAAAGAVTSTEAEEVKRIQLMIKDSPDLINARLQGLDANRLGTPLEVAADKGQLVVARFLLANGADVEAKDLNGETALHLAAAGGHRAMAELLLSKKAPLGAFDKQGRTPLHAAAEKGFKSVVELLLANGADVNARTDAGPTPLHLAVANGFRTVAEVLLARGADPNIVAPSVYGSGVNYQGGAPLHIAAQRGDTTMTELLLANKAQINAFSSDGFTPLHLAVQKGAMANIDYLLAHGAQVNAKAEGVDYRGWPPLAFAVNREKKEIVAQLLEKGADPNLPFDLVHDRRSPDGTRVLLNSGRGYTSLLVATILANVPIAEVLLAHQADPNIANTWGLLPLNYMILHRGAEEEPLLKALLDHGANPEARVVEGLMVGSPILVAAAQQNDVIATRLLLAHKANVNAQDKNGMTALHYAALATGNGQLDGTELGRLLLDAGADPNRQNSEGRTPLSFLPVPPRPLSEYQTKMVTLLREHGALEDLPRMDHIVIRRLTGGPDVAQRTTAYSAALFYKGTNGWNEFTLVELLGVQYKLLTGYPQGENRERWAVVPYNGLQYPDLSHLRLRRPTKDLKSWQESTVDLGTAMRAGDCSVNPNLAWGDIIEVPEVDHPLNVPWPGFSTAELDTFKKCLGRDVEVVIKGKSTKVNLSPEVNMSFGSFPDRVTGRSQGILTGFCFWIKPVLLNSGLLLASSDLSRVKVTRTDAKSGQKREWVVDCSESSPAPDLWLRDGDVLEVPEKP